MKVIHFIDTLGRGGAEQLLVTLLPELRRQKVEVSVVVRGGAQDLAPELEAEGIAVHRLQHRHRWNIPGAAKELARIVTKDRADIVHAHLYFPAVITAVMRGFGFCKLPTCVTFHNLAYGGANRQGLKLGFRRLLARGSYRVGIERFFAVSDAVARHYKDAMSLRDIVVIPNPVDLSKMRGLEDVEGHDRLVLPGRLVREKGHADLLDALVHLKGEGLCPDVIFAGDGPMRREIERRAEELGLSEQIEITGALSNDRMLSVMAGASLVIVPSRFEGFGLTALESMALGRAVVVSDAGGLPEVVGDAGIVVPASDPTALAEAISGLMSDAGRRAELGAMAAERARLFDLGSVATQQIAAYQDLARSCGKQV